MRYALVISQDEGAHGGTEAEQRADFQALAEKLGPRRLASVGSDGPKPRFGRPRV